jgi:N-acetylmuramoyl-L-alanine amidase
MALMLLAVAGCGTVRPGKPEPRKGDEIVAAGRFFHTGTRVVLWMDPGGYDAYRVEPRFDAAYGAGSEVMDTGSAISPNRYNLREEGLTTNELARVWGGGWDLRLLQKEVDQFVIHFDDAGTSRTCFKVLHDERGLSVHFLLDLDGTIYQTLDLKERAWHATTSNDRSVGVEIANLGGRPPDDAKDFDEWYARDAKGRTTITIPARFGDGGIRTTNFTGHPARPEPVRGMIQGQELVQYDYTPQQYAALVKLTAALCKVFPKIQCRYPVDAHGRLIPCKLPDDQLEGYEGVLGHYHIQTNKVDPGPAFQWDLVIGGARRELGLPLMKAPGN